MLGHGVIEEEDGILQGIGAAKPAASEAEGKARDAVDDAKRCVYNTLQHAATHSTAGLNTL